MGWRRFGEIGFFSCKDWRKDFSMLAFVVSKILGFKPSFAQVGDEYEYLKVGLRKVLKSMD